MKNVLPRKLNTYRLDLACTETRTSTAFQKIATARTPNTKQLPPA